ncbi:MAG: hypothetical protein R3223_08320 [Longimicrobiales bacterium]|nr:hypothetical protein [Longimicrobiales bacterium]
MIERSIVVVALSIAVGLPTTAPHASAQQPRPPTCTSEEHRQFDFWVGSWDVFDPDGRQVGTNEIRRQLNGCALHESWESLAGPHRGHSYNIYDRSTGRWHQTWVDNSGLLLQLDGGIEEGRMVLEGRTRNADGDEVLNRITWSPLDDTASGDEAVRQLWQTSEDGGETWSVVFDGRYVKR